VAPIGSRTPTIGDVILFVPACQDEAVAHRVVGTSPEGLCTRGDNRTEIDDWLVLPEQVLGRVVAVWRGGQRQAIPGRRTGRCWARLQRQALALDRQVSRLVHPLYFGLGQLLPLGKLLPAHLKPRVVRFQRSRRYSLRLMMGDRVIGRYDTYFRRWYIRRPLRLFVDQRLLDRTAEVLTPPSGEIEAHTEPPV
jgi:hypothetical protein